MRTPQARGPGKGPRKGTSTPVADLARLVPQDAVQLDVDAPDARAVLALLAAMAAQRTGLPERAVLDALGARERVGSTGVGHGVAVPHARMQGMTGQQGALLRLAHPVEFGASDLQPCDLFVLLLAPPEAAGDHLKALAALSRRLREAPVRAALRAARDAAGLHAALVG